MKISNLGGGLLLRRRMMKQDNDIRPIQIYRNGNFADGTEYWEPYSSNNGSLSAADGELTYTPIRRLSTSYGNKIQNTAAHFKGGHKYYIAADIHVPIVCNISFVYASGAKMIREASAGWNHYSTVYIWPNDSNLNYMGVNSMASFEAGDVVVYKNIIAIDLTETFGAGNEPSKDWCDAKWPGYVDYYNPGE